MAKRIVVFFSLMILSFMVQAQVKIHSHNDYTHPKPFYDAIENKAFSIEADVFLVKHTLIVAHSRKEIKGKNTLEKLYLKPIRALSKKDKYYTFQLMIDFKDNFDLTYPVLLKALKKYKNSFEKNGMKISVVISGNRPADSTFHQYKELFFDGLPNHQYPSEDLNKVVMISDNFATYSKWKGVGEISDQDKEKLQKVINDAHQIGKPFRFWNAPDYEACWELLCSLGADIINTDQVATATNYFKTN
ncbi:phosphatidylinositol-specific phospholipase C/glycerophosphodiester phosphodiesterase family protein [Pedobacter chinensis]|nr:phosphatidylinositol-specific phospholipase C/glycerophosphodiester phosphodiesterase family protein [Pedobacter chinensis]